MPEQFIHNPSATFSDIKTNLDQCLLKTIAIHDKIMHQCFNEQGELLETADLLITTLWVMKGMLDELERLRNNLYKFQH